MTDPNAEYVCPICRDTGQVDGDTCPDALARFEQALRERRRAEAVDSERLLLMNDDATVTVLTRCRDCDFLFVDIDKHVRESVTVRTHINCSGSADG